MDNPSPYTKEFYGLVRNGAERSAEVIAPLVLKMLSVHSVVDVGCGDGSWLAVFRKLGVDDVLGVDGDHVSKEVLRIPIEYFRSSDLRKPLTIDRVFDLALSLEVAEHLPSNCSAQFIESLTRLSRVVLFSAAIPYQGGTEHINEQWPDKWASLFEKHGYLPLDAIRRRVWQDDSVEWWYAQNVMLFVDKTLVESQPALRAEFERSSPNQLRLVHPRQFLHLRQLYEDALRRAEEPRLPSGVTEASRQLFVCLKNALRSRFLAISGKGRYPTERPRASGVSSKS
jgi:SAM-dependent methyltransferase